MLKEGFKNLTGRAKAKAQEAGAAHDLQQVLKGYTLEGDGVRGCTASGGHRGLWRVYTASRDGARTPCCVWLLNKRELEEQAGKAHAAQIVEWLSHGVRMQCRVVHPSVVRVMEPFREKGQYAMCVTEPVTASLRNLLGDLSGIDVVQDRVRSWNAGLSEPERRYGMFQLAEGLAFLHGEAKLWHLNLTPGSVWVTPKGDWKLGCFEFCLPAQGGDRAPSNNFRLPSGGDMYDSSINPLLGPELAYAAPEYVRDARPHHLSDQFSFGCLMYAVFGKAESGVPQLLTPGQSVAQYHSQVSALPARDLSACGDAAETIRSLVATPDRGGGSIAAVMRGSALFVAMPIRCLIMLDRIAPKDEATKLSFLRDLYGVVSDYNERVIHTRVLPVLLAELPAPAMQRYVLPILLRCVPKLGRGDFGDAVMPALRPLLATGSPQIAAILLEKIVDVAAKCTAEELRADIAPFIRRQLQANPSAGLFDVALQLCRGGSIAPADVQSNVVPSLLQAAVQHRAAALRRHALGTLERLLQGLPPQCITDQIVTQLRGRLLHEQDEEVVFALSALFVAAAGAVPPEAVAASLLPSIVPIIPAAPTLTRLAACYSIAQGMLEKMRDGTERRIRQRDAPQSKPAEPPEPAVAADWQSGLLPKAPPPQAAPALPPPAPSGFGWEQPQQPTAEAKSGWDHLSMDWMGPAQAASAPAQAAAADIFAAPAPAPAPGPPAPADPFGSLAGAVSKAKDLADPTPWMRQAEGPTVSDLCDPYRKPPPPPPFAGNGVSHMPPLQQRQPPPQQPPQQRPPQPQQPAQPANPFVQPAPQAADDDDWAGFTSNRRAQSSVQQPQAAAKPPPQQTHGAAGWDPFAAPPATQAAANPSDPFFGGVAAAQQQPPPASGGDIFGF
eukprot:TRINITY_DN4942_c1_g4_i1.p1 TRINITY_DN4942_c1_g4~~TRINITY_DN4942_c1_g4_i1.p1  ORF type:complete len:895 (+),score=293.00 TRINITY_DN4942_c1_g4_i1:85-2769(+)